MYDAYLDRAELERLICKADIAPSHAQTIRAQNEMAFERQRAATSPARWNDSSTT
ncbi:MAG: hypothetical protein ACTJG2_01575 [Candidatus Saccharimonadales bacterium]